MKTQIDARLAKIAGQLNIAAILEDGEAKNLRGHSSNSQEIADDLERIATQKTSQHEELGRYREVKYDELESHQQEEMDGKLNKIKTIYRDRLTNEDGLVKSYNQTLLSVARNIEGVKNEINNEFAIAKKAWESHDLPNGFSETENYYSELRNTNAYKHEETVKVLTTELTDLRKERQTSYNELCNLSYTLWKVTVPHRPSSWRKIIYGFGLGAIAVAEMPVNYPVFQLFGE